jgi:hypothetical protein
MQLPPSPPRSSRPGRRLRRFVGSVLTVVMMMSGIALATPAAAAPGDPVGSFDGVGVSAYGKIQVVGWAADPRAPGSRVEVHVYVTGPSGVIGTGGIYTGQPRADVRQVYPWAGSNQGFAATVPSAGIGDNQVCVYAINVLPPQTNPGLGCRTIRVGGAPPTGYIDSVTATGSSAAIRGWAFDPSRSGVSIPVHVYVTGTSTTGTALMADGDRPDVNRVFGITGRHGFTGTVPLTSGTNTVCAYGIGENGNNALIGGCRTVQGPAPAGAVPPARPGGKPNASNTGVPAGTSLTDYTGPLTITTDGTVIDGKAVYGDLRIQARNVTIRNSYLHCGKDIPAGNTGCVDANSAKVFNLTVENTTINPDYPSYYRDGIVGHEFTSRRNHITRTNDGLGIFNRPGGPAQANVTAEGNYIHDLTHWNYDPAHSDGTHNDGIQIQGGENIVIRGNNVVGSVVAGDGLGAFGTHGGAALLAQQNVAKLANVVIENNWFDDAQNSVCIQHGKYSSVAVTLQNNYFGRNQYDFGNSSKYPIRIYSKSASQVTGLATNRWEDSNALLTEGRDSGIRFNGP